MNYKRCVGCHKILATDFHGHPIWIKPSREEESALALIGTSPLLKEIIGEQKCEEVLCESCEKGVVK